MVMANIRNEILKFRSFCNKPFKMREMGYSNSTSLRGELVSFMLRPLDLCNRCNIKLVSEVDAEVRCP